MTGNTSYQFSTCYVFQTPVPSGFPWPLLYGQSGTYNFNLSTDSDIAEMASYDMHLQIGAVSDRRAVLRANHAMVVDGTMAGWADFLCPNGRNACEDTAAQEQQLFDWVSNYLQSIKDDPDIVAFWILDDYVISAPWVLEKIHALVAQANQTSIVQRATICGFGGTLDIDVNTTPPVRDWAYYNGEFSNFSPSACDFVTLYPYASGYPDVSSDRVDWAMSKLLPDMMQGLQNYGWDSSKQPLIGMPQSFSSPVTGNGTMYYRPTAGQLATQVSSYCQAGAVDILTFIWRDDPDSFDTPATDASLKQGLLQGLQSCRALW